MKHQFWMVIATAIIATAALFGLFWFAGETRAAVNNAQLSPDVEPTVTAVQPDSTTNDVDTPIVIKGTGFSATFSGTQVITAPTVYLGDQRLQEVIWGSTTTLSATVPWGLAPEVYSITVVNPDEISVTLQNAFTVTDGFGVFTTDGPYGGDIIEIHKKPGTPTTVYALAADVGLFISEDSGETWRLIYPADHFSHLVFDAQDPDVLYMNTNGMMVRSLDGGETWQTPPEIGSPGSGLSAYPVTHPTEAGRVFLGKGNNYGPLDPGEGGVYRSDDYGMTWVTKTNGITDANIVSLAIDPMDPDTMLAGTYNGNLYVSLNGGENWSLSTHLDGHVNSLYFNPYEQSPVWASAINDLWEVTLYSSTNLSDWNPVTIGPPPNSGDRWRFTFLPGTIWASHGTVYTSTDDGTSWSEIAGLPYGDGINVAEITPDNPDEIYLGSGIGIDRSTDGGQSYQRSNQGLAGQVPKVVAVSPSDLETVFVQTNVGDYRTFNGGATWQELFIGVGGFSGNIVAFDAYSSTRLYMGSEGLSIFNMGISPDAGATWEYVTKTLPAEYDGWSSGAQAIAAHPAIPGQVFAGVTVAPPGSNCGLPGCLGLIYRSSDYGRSWTHIETTEPISMILDIAFDAVDPNLIYLATQDSGLWKSTDGGTTWQATPLPGGYTQINQIAVHPTLSGHLVIETDQRGRDPALYASYDAGETWEFLDERGVPLVYAPTFPPVLYGYGLNQFYQGILVRSFDDGHTWEEVPAAPYYPVQLATATDGERVVLYIGSLGGLATQAGAQTVLSTNDFQADTTIFGGGVYRLTELMPTDWIYLPSISR